MHHGHEVEDETLTWKMNSSRRNFIWNAGALCITGATTGCVTEPSRTAARSTRGAVVRVRDLEGSFDWPKLAHESGLTTLATHIGPEDVMPFLRSERGRKFLDECERCGLEVEHELHAMDYLLPRELFSREPELFRMDANGRRTPKYNCCVSNPIALEIVASRAVEVAKVCRPTTGRYFFWLSDNGHVCRCPRCRAMSGADQAIAVENAIVGALRAEIDPCATLAHLAYQVTMETPTLKPHPGLFLEYAPIRRWRDGNTVVRKDLMPGSPFVSRLADLLKVFPVETAQVLEYWIDASLFCGWKKPLVRIPWDAERTRADVRTYRRLGVRHVTSFAVDVSDDYQSAFGPGSVDVVREYGRILSEELA